MAEYEFDSSQNQIIGTVGSRAMTWGSISLAGGVTSLLGAIAEIALHGGGTGALVLVFAAFPQLSVGLSFRSAGRALHDVVETRGHDVTLLRKAMRRIVDALRIQIGVTLLFTLLVMGLGAARFLVKQY